MPSNLTRVVIISSAATGVLLVLGGLLTILLTLFFDKKVGVPLGLLEIGCGILGLAASRSLRARSR